LFVSYWERRSEREERERERERERDEYERGRQRFSVIKRKKSFRDRELKL
jgi:hypothetical protein